MLTSFKEVWLVDFEFLAPSGENPTPICLGAKEWHTGKILRQWRDEFGPMPPYDTGPDALFVAYYASAELGCHLALGWPMPMRILDLFTEFRCRTNSLPVHSGIG
jgi:DNA polymerase-1